MPPRCTMTIATGQDPDDRRSDLEKAVDEIRAVNAADAAREAARLPKPCPFCRTPEPAVVPAVGGMDYEPAFVKCSNFRCGARGPQDWDKAVAVALWNDRTA